MNVSHPCKELTKMHTYAYKFKRTATGSEKAILLKYLELLLIFALFLVPRPSDLHLVAVPTR